ncbi:transcriptional regulator [Salmonella bongori]|nr:transcriptional regulator [Salmonella bongori]
MTPRDCGWEGWVASQQGWRIDVLAHSLNQLRPELFDGKTLLGVVRRKPDAGAAATAHSMARPGARHLSPWHVNRS